MQNFLPLITGSAGALVVLALVAWGFYAGQLHSDREFSKLEEENSHLRQENSAYRLALDLERKTVNETAAAGQVTNQLIRALVAAARKGTPELTAEDLGL